MQHENPLYPYRRAIMALVGAVLLSLHGFYSDDILTGAEMLQAFFQGLGAFTLYALPDAPGYRYVKPVVAGLTVGLQVLIAANNMGSPYDTELWLNVAISVGTALGVLIVKNDPEPAVPPTADTEARFQLPRAA